MTPQERRAQDAIDIANRAEPFVIQYLHRERNMEQKNDVMRGIRFLKENGQPDAAKIAQEARARATRCKNLTATGKDNTFSSWTDSDWFKCCYSEVVAQAEGEQAIWLQRMGFTSKVSAAEARELSTDGRL